MGAISHPTSKGLKTRAHNEDSNCTILGIDDSALARILADRSATRERQERARYRVADKRAARARKFERAAKRALQGQK